MSILRTELCRQERAASVLCPQTRIRVAVSSVWARRSDVSRVTSRGSGRDIAVDARSRAEETELFVTEHTEDRASGSTQKYKGSVFLMEVG